MALNEVFRYGAESYRFQMRVDHDVTGQGGLATIGLAAADS